VLEHAGRTAEPTLYVCDAGHNGMAHVCLLARTGQHLLMELKMGDLAEQFRASRQRSRLLRITLTAVHLKNYPQHAHLGETAFTVRLIR